MKMIQKSIGLFLCILLTVPVFASAEREAARPVFGDVNSDETVAPDDALRALQITVFDVDYALNPALDAAAETRKQMPTLYLLDVNGDYQIAALDALLILQYTVRLIDKFPVEQLGVYDMYMEEDSGIVSKPDEGVQINETNFPDEVFRADVRGLDLDGNGWLSKDEIERVTTLDLSALSDSEAAMVPSYLVPTIRQKIKTLQGLKYFTALTELNCDENALTSLDLSSNTALRKLSCNHNKLTTLDLSQNVALVEVSCSGNQLSELLLERNSLLEALFCKNNLLTQLDVTHNPALNYIARDENVIVTGWATPDVDVVEINETNFPDEVFRSDVRAFDLDENGWLSEAEIAEVTEIDITCYDVFIPEIKPIIRSKISTIKGIEYFTELKILSCANNKLSSLDVSNNRKLEELDCNANQLAELDVQNNEQLSKLICSLNQLSELNVTNNTALTVLDCGYNQIDELNLNQNALLQVLSCSRNQITQLDLTHNPKLYYVTYDKGVIVTGWSTPDVDVVQINETNFPDPVFRNDVKEFDLDENGWLSEAEIAQVTKIDVNALPSVIAIYPPPPSRQKIRTLKGIEFFTQLEYLDCTSNFLTKLDISNNIVLTSLYCGGNFLDVLDVSHNTILHSLDCSGNQLTELNVSHIPNLEQLNCSNNQISDLDIRQNKGIKDLYCSNNLLTDLDITNNTVLNTLICNGNNLEGLNIEFAHELDWLECTDNQLNGLDLSQNKLLWYLDCSNNKIHELNLTQNTVLHSLKCDDDVRVIGWNK